MPPNNPTSTTRRPPARIGMLCLLLCGAAGAQAVFYEFPDGRAPEERRAEYLRRAAEENRADGYGAAARLALGMPVDEAAVLGALRRVDRRRDCADFSVHGFIRLMAAFGESPALSGEFKERVRRSLTGFKYWPDEPGRDSMCYWSENHFILFASAGYLTGQLWPDEVFTNSGRTGREQMERFRPRILRWLDLRFRSGFSEWNSNVYYDEDLTALLNLADLCGDPEIARRAAMVTDLLLLDIALNSHRGVFGATHGRTYENEKKHAAAENTGATAWLMFGFHSPEAGHMSATLAALGNYRLPRVIAEIAADAGRREEMENRQRTGFPVEEAAQWGLDPSRMEDGMTFLTQEAYTHPAVINLFTRMMDKYHWWDNNFFTPFRGHRMLIHTARKAGILPAVAWCFRHDLQRNLRGRANLLTFRTPDYMLSTAQDYRRGFGGDQQHIWQATLAPDAVCFTTHPAGREREESPDYWTGSGSLPRSAQVKNVAISLYHISTLPALYVPNTNRFTHAWLPKDRFDEVAERGRWIFARKDRGYLALWSREAWHWQAEEGPDKDREIIAPGTQNIWICELGREAADGSFGEFMGRILAAPLETRGLSVRYQSPSQGLLEFGWHGPLRQNGAPVDLEVQGRYENPYTRAEFPAETVLLELNGHSLLLDWKSGTRGTDGAS